MDVGSRGSEERPAQSAWKQEGHRDSSSHLDQVEKQRAQTHSKQKKGVTDTGSKINRIERRKTREKKLMKQTKQNKKPITLFLKNDKILEPQAELQKIKRERKNELLI